MSDFTLERQLCDDAGMVSDLPVSPQNAFNPDLTYLQQLNNLRAATGFEPVSEEFSCTGSAHLAGEHIKCTSPAHSNYCPDCGRLKGIGCDCGLPFAEKMQSRAVRYGGWAPSKSARWQPPKRSTD